MNASGVRSVSEHSSLKEVNQSLIKLDDNPLLISSGHKSFNIERSSSLNDSNEIRPRTNLNNLKATAPVLMKYITEEPEVTMEQLMKTDSSVTLNDPHNSMKFKESYQELSERKSSYDSDMEIHLS